MQLKKRNTIPESIVIAIIIGGISLIPHMETIPPFPQAVILVTALFLAFWHGRVPGIIAYMTAQSVNLAGGYFISGTLPVVEHALIQGTTGIILCYVGGSLNQFRLYQMEKILTRYRKLSDKKSKLQEISTSQQEIIRELEERVTRQRTSLNLLFDRVLEIDCQNTNKSISILLDTIIHFTDADQISLWAYNNISNSLQLKMRKGGNSEGGHSEPLDLKTTIEGWVFRNNQMFSIRMAMDYDSLALFNTDGSIICCPIMLDNKTWGVINIESLPFIKYSNYTENIIQMIINLSQPALKKSLDFESFLIREEENANTGLPQFTQLYRILERYKYDESGTFNSSSLIILEFQNFRELIEQYSLKRIQILQKQLLSELSTRSQKGPEIFHYREESSMALFIPYMDYDGCSLFCLESLEFINREKWQIQGDSLRLEINLGYASSGTREKMDPEDLIKRAEYLLEIQKI